MAKTLNELNEKMKFLELKIHPPIVALICFGLAWLSKISLPLLNFDLNGSKIIAICCITVGFALAVLGILTFRKQKTTIKPNQPELSSKLVTHGIYTVTRNPMYLGIFITLVGGGFYFQNLLSLVIPLFFVFYITQFQIKPEERILTKKFGADYLAYQNKTRRWI